MINLPQDKIQVMVEFKEGDQIEYLGSTPFILGNSQKFTFAGEIQEAISDTSGQVEYFRKPLGEISSAEVTSPTIDELHAQALEENASK